MKAICAVAVLALFVACQPSSGPDTGVVGVYDPDLSGMDESETPQSGGFSLELKDDRTFVRVWETEDGPRSHPGTYSLGDRVDDCVQLEAIPEEAPDIKTQGLVCDGVLKLFRPRGDTLVFRLRR